MRKSILIFLTMSSLIAICFSAYAGLKGDIIGKWIRNGGQIEFLEDGTVIASTIQKASDDVGDYKFIDEQRIRIDWTGKSSVYQVSIFDDILTLRNDTEKWAYKKLSQAALLFLSGAKQMREKNYSMALDELMQCAGLGDTECYNALAWIYATCPDAKHRDGKKAVEYATKAATKAHKNKPGFPALLDTLAVAYARNGDFDKAVKSTNDAIEILRADEHKTKQDEEFLGRLRKRIELYKAGKAYVEESALLN